jgi:tetratricopeptide (TPR) repeat protein
MARRKPNRFEDEFFSLSKGILSVIFDKRYAEAKLLIDKEQARFPARHAHRFMSLSAVLLRRSGEVEQSIALMRQALREKPTWLPHLYQLSVLLMDLERWDEAEVLLKEIVALSLAKSEFYFLDESRYRRAVCLHRLGRTEEFKRARAEIPPGTRIFLDDQHCEIDEFLG